MHVQENAIPQILHMRKDSISLDAAHMVTTSFTSALSMDSLYKEDNFNDFLSVFLHNNPYPEKETTLQEE